MNHLTEDQLSAFADGALAERERSACEAHLADCEACRARLAELSALDRSLAGALEHDPGEAYFESFADRVAARIAAEAPAAKGERAKARRTGGGSPIAWLLTPRGLSLVGGTAVLVAVASLAWMRFQGRDDVTRLMPSRPPSPVGSARQQAPPPVASNAVPAPAESNEASQAPAPPPAPPPALEQERRGSRERTADALAARPSDESRASGSKLDAREQGLAAKTESAPPAAQRPLAAADRAAEGAPPPASAPVPFAAPPRADAKRLAAPATPAPAAAKGQPREEAMASREAVVPSETAGVAQDLAGRRLTTSERRGLAFTQDALSPCGTVLDSRGTPIAGARVTVTNDGLRTTRSGPDGRFCLPSIAAGDTLSILRVGYEPQRVVVGPGTSLAVQLEPIGTLGPEAGRLLAREGPTALAPRAGAARAGALVPPPAAPVADVYEGQAEAVRLAVVDAREADEFARREGTARAYERSSEGWAKVASRATGAAVLDARFHSLASLRAAYRTEPTPVRRARLQAGLAAFVASAPPSLPERATVIRWQAELVPPGGKALYR